MLLPARKGSRLLLRARARAPPRLPSRGRAACDRERRALGSRRPAVRCRHVDVRRVAERLVRRAAMMAFRVAVVGTGRMSGSWLPLLRDRPDVEVVAFAELDSAAARTAAESHGLSAPIFRDLETAAQATAPDVVVNLTPPESHRPVVETALGLGCHVLGEKPIATTLEDAQALIRAATAADRIYAVMQNRRFEHGIRTLRVGLGEGRIGSVTMLACDFFKAPHFGGFREEMESPLLVDMAIHHFDQARFLAGVDPVAVSCHELNFAGSWYRGDATALCTFEFPDGLVFSYRGSWSAEGFGTSWNGS